MFAALSVYRCYLSRTLLAAFLRVVCLRITAGDWALLCGFFYGVWSLRQVLRRKWPMGFVVLSAGQCWSRRCYEVCGICYINVVVSCWHYAVVVSCLCVVGVGG